MKKWCKKQWRYVEEPHHFRKINGWLTVIWFLAAFPICIFLASSIPFLVFVSVYAVVTGHLATWQAARVEVEQQAQSEQQEREYSADWERMERKIDEVHDLVVERPDVDVDVKVENGA